MSTENQLKGVMAICETQWPKLSPQTRNQPITRRTFAAMSSAVMVLPAMGATIDASFVGSPALLYLALFFLIGFGVPWYIFMHQCLEAYAASEAETALGQGLLETPAAPQMVLSQEDKRAAGSVRSSGKKAGYLSRRHADA